jgi:hypothetical protein
MTSKTAANRPMTRFEWSLLLTMSVFWGVSFPSDFAFQR